ncbi:MAG: PAS domain-containing protein, partial [Gammaproteobacteria bacterium]|nr:PAS domain-containing protein [Gammaproteobacteria bacterium]
MSSLELEEFKNQIQILKIQLKNEQERSSYNCSAFETIYKQSSDGVLLIEDGKFVNCNDAIIKLLHCDSEKQVLNMHPSQLSPEFQPDGSTSLEKANTMMQLAVDKGHHRFEWVHKRVDGE